MKFNKPGCVKITGGNFWKFNKRGVGEKFLEICFLKKTLKKTFFTWHRGRRARRVSKMPRHRIFYRHFHFPAIIWDFRYISYTRFLGMVWIRNSVKLNKIKSHKRTGHQYSPSYIKNETVCDPSFRSSKKSVPHLLSVEKSIRPDICWSI